MKDAKLCVDCEHYRFSRGFQETGPEAHKCFGGKVEEHLDVVTGKIEKTSGFLGYCYDIRSYRGKCGQEGKLFERKEYPFGKYG